MKKSSLQRTSRVAILSLLVAQLVFANGAQSMGRRVPSFEESYQPYSRKPSKKALDWANQKLKRMSLDEKIGQLISVGVNATFLIQDSEAFKALRHRVVDNHVGGIILFRGPVYESVVLVNRMQELAKYPLLISSDLEAGSGMRFDDTVNFPWNMAIAATGNPDYARRAGDLTGREARAMGIQQIYAPVSDVNNNAANPVINVRSYGEDPIEVSRYVSAFVEGAQRAGVIATAKHFPGHGDTATDSHRGLPEIDVTRERLNSIELVPFRAAVDAGVGAVMTGHIGLPLIDSTEITPLPKDLKLDPIETDQDGESAGKHANDLADDIAKDAITLVRNDAKLLPLNINSASRIFNLAVTNGDDRAVIAQPFVAALGRGGLKVETIVLDDRSSDAE